MEVKNKVSQNLLNFVKNSELNGRNIKRHNFTTENSEMRSVGNLSDFQIPESNHKHEMQTLNLKNRAQSVENFRHFNSTGE